MGLKGKVVGFDSSKATDEKTGHVGAVSKNEINARAQQKTVKAGGYTHGLPGLAGAGDYKDKPGQPTRNSINENSNARRWPAASKVKASNKIKRKFGGSDTNGRAGKSHYYGGGQG